MNKKTDFIGKVCRCAQGQLGVVAGKRTTKGQTVWTGYRLPDRKNWESKNPIIVFESIDQYYLEQIANT